MQASYDAIVVGSGFGGGIAACRLAEAGRRVCVLERGRRFGRDDFPGRPDQAGELVWHPAANPGGMFDVRLMRDLVVITAAGVGGGSLVYANVQLRAPAAVFDDPRWPAAIDAATLEPWYVRTEDALQPRTTPGGAAAAQGRRVRRRGRPRRARGGAAAARRALRRAPRAPLQRRAAGGLPEPRALRHRVPGAREEHGRHHVRRAGGGARRDRPAAARGQAPRAARPRRRRVERRLRAPGRRRVRRRPRAAGRARGRHDRIAAAPARPTAAACPACPARWAPASRATATRWASRSIPPRPTSRTPRTTSGRS